LEKPTTFANVSCLSIKEAALAVDKLRKSLSIVLMILFNLIYKNELIHKHTVYNIF
jgi:hypothetical protein